MIPFVLEADIELILGIVYDTSMKLDEMGALIRTARRKAGLSQAELAKRRGMSRATLSQIETGVVQEIGIRKVVGLCAEVGLTLSVTEITRPTLAETIAQAQRAKFDSATQTDRAILNYGRTKT